MKARTVVFAAIGVMAGLLIHQQVEISALSARHATRVVVQPAAHTAPQSCPYSAASCVTTKGHYGLVLTGSRAASDLGGDPLMVTDYHHAPEMWVQGGNLYVLAKPGWVGGELCIDVALRANYCLTYKDVKWLDTHAK